MNSNAWPYAVEPMSLDDVPSVGSIERMVFARPWPVDAYNYELLENPKSHYLVARLKEKEPLKASRSGFKEALRRAMTGPDIDRSLLGYGGLWLVADEAHICTLAVHPGWRQRHIGELLLASLVEKAMELGSACVTLECRVSNYVAQNLYEKYGFNRVGLRKGYYSDNHEDAFIMTTDPIDTPEYQARFLALRETLDARLTAQALNQTSDPLPTSL